MLSAGDFAKKQIVFVFFHQGEKLSFSNDNMVVRTADGAVKFQCTCYRLFLVFAIGYGSVTSGLIQRAKKFGFSIVMMTQGMRTYQIIGNALEGNTLLRKAQYGYSSLDLAKHITENKIYNQKQQLRNMRVKHELQREAVKKLEEYLPQVQTAQSLHELMGYEGSAARVYFPAYFNNIPWQRRAPRTKCDMVNSALDIGYTMLFSFVEAILNCFGFDTYCGVMHTNFYMRKSLVCDLVEPFRVLIDAQVKKAIHLRQCREEDFLVDNGRYLLKWEKNPAYISWLAQPIMENKEALFLYIQAYYRAFMKHKPAEQYPVFRIGEPL